MYSRTFQSVINEIKNSNFQLADKLLSSIDSEAMTPASLELFNKLSSVIQKSSAGNRIIPEKLHASVLSDFDNQKILPGTSIVSCCMNRNENLRKALKTWVKLPVDEIVLVDWSSDEPVVDFIDEFKDKRIKVLRVENEQKWILTIAFNVGLRFANYSKVFKFDADIQVAEDFLELNSFNHRQFVRGYWKKALEEDLVNQVYVNGSFGASKSDLMSVGYYNELIQTYGWDDSDIYERLSSECGLETKYLNVSSLIHLEQDESQRTASQDVVREDFLEIITPTEFNNQRNKFIGRTTDYWNINRLQDFSVTKVNQQVWSLQRYTKTISVAPYIIHDADVYAALHFLSSRYYSLVQKSNSPKDLATLLVLEFQSKIDINTTLTLLGGTSTPHLVKCYNAEESSFSEFLDSCMTISNQEKVHVYALCKRDTYSHEKIYDENDDSVEILSLPSALVDVVVGQRQSNGYDFNKNENIDTIDDEDFHKQLKTTRKKNRLAIDKNKFFVDAQHGLGNRLRAIGSAAAIAKATGKQLVIVWEPDHHCECRFSDLFDYDGEVVEKSFLERAKQEGDVFNYMEVEEGAEKDKPIEVSSFRYVYARAAYTFVHEASHWEAENEFIKALKPAKQVEELIKPFNVDGYIAAHVRMEAGKGLDHNTYDSVENWTQEGHDQLHYWREKSHYSAFIKRIDELIKQDEDAKLFVATDLQETYDIFQRYYGDRLVYLKRDVFDRSQEQIIYALADVLLLSKCKKLLGSTWSSFSEAAMRLSDTYSKIEMSGRDF